MARVCPLSLSLAIFKHSAAKRRYSSGLLIGGCPPSLAIYRNAGAAPHVPCAAQARALLMTIVGQSVAKHPFFRPNFHPGHPAGQNNLTTIRTYILHPSRIHPIFESSSLSTGSAPPGGEDKVQHPRAYALRQRRELCRWQEQTGNRQGRGDALRVIVSRAQRDTSALARVVRCRHRSRVYPRSALKCAQVG